MTNSNNEPNNPNKDRRVNMDRISESRLWKVLDGIDERLNGIENTLSEVVRLEERLKSHDQALHRYGNRLDSHDNRLRENELWQANHGDRASIERMITNIQDDIQDNLKKVDILESKYDVNAGRKDIGKEILKWFSGILAATLIFMMTGK